VGDSGLLTSTHTLSLVGTGSDETYTFNEPNDIYRSYGFMIGDNDNDETL
jgi:hypothetical protein